MNPDDELLAIFRAEVGAELERLDELLSAPVERWSVRELVRLAHNVKGNATLTESRAMATVAHALEDLFENFARSGTIPAESAEIARRGAAVLAGCLDANESEIAESVSALRLLVDRALERVVVPRPVEREVTGDGSEEDAPAKAGARNVGESADTVRVRLARIEELTGLVAELGAVLERVDQQHALAAELLSAIEPLRGARRGGELDPVARSARALVAALAEDGPRRRRLAGEIRGAVHGLRMIPVDTLRGPLRAIASEAATVTGKDARLVFEGCETELDRRVVEAIRDPIAHILRNAIAHGIEARAQRERRNKPPVGLVTFRARAAGTWVEISIEDDGAGIDLAALIAKAKASGIVEPDAAVSDREAMDLVFAPGMSTAGSVSSIAGRGFGMDIVRSKVEALGGSVELRTTLGAGTEVRLRVPLTRLSTRALVVIADGQPMAIPVESVERAIVVAREQVQALEGGLLEGGEVIALGDALVPVVSLAAVLGLDAEVDARAPAVVVVSGEHRVALVVDDLAGEREIFVQGIEGAGHHDSCIAGAEVVASGEILLMLDPQLLVARAARAAQRTRSVESADERRRRVLVVDDSVTSRTLVSGILKAAGLDVLMAVDGQAALELLRTTAVDVVVSDVEMPRMTGIELTTALRASPDHARLRVILVTSRGEEAEQRRGAAAGADAYIVKGAFDQDALLRAVRRLT